MPLRLDTPMPPLRPVHRWLNGPTREADLQGRPVLVHFWALSCPTCKEQLTRLVEWQARHPELQIVSIHTPLSVEDMHDERIADAVAAFELGMPVALDGDDGALADAFHIQVLPAFFVFDSDGRLRLYHAGPDALEPVGRALDRVTAHASPDAEEGTEEGTEEAAADDAQVDEGPRRREGHDEGVGAAH